MRADFEDALRAQIRELEEKRARLDAELGRIDGHLGGLRQALSLYMGQSVSGHEPSRVPTTRARGKRTPDPRKSEAWAFALSKLEDAPSEGMDVEELDAALSSAGYHMQRNTLRANLSNAAKDGIVERVRYGRYRKPKIVVEIDEEHDAAADDSAESSSEEPAARSPSDLI